jgi:hypothetical protein
VVQEPKPGTLRRYGLSLAEWREYLSDQGGVCYVCQKVPPNGRLCVDHHHVKGWKRMPPESRKRHVRGLLCSYCNRRLVAKGMTAERAQRIHTYLESYARRLASWGLSRNLISAPNLNASPETSKSSKSATSER